MKRAGCASSESSSTSPLLLASLLAMLLAGCARTETPAPITTAEVILQGVTVPPGDDAGWSRQSLPDDWSRSRPGYGGDAWYRMEFQLEPQQLRLTAIYIPRLNMTGRPWVNGTPIAIEERFDEPLTRMWYRPQFYLVPVQLLKVGTNVLHLRIRAYPDSQGGLSQVHVGDPRVLRPLWQRHVRWQVTAMQVTTGITAVLGLLVLAAWAVLRRDSAYGWFALAALFWTAHSLLVLAVDIPVPARVWELSIATTLAWVVVSLMMFALRFAAMNRPWLERSVLGYALLVPVVALAAGSSHIAVTVNALLLVLAVIGAWEVKILADVARRVRSPQSVLLLCAALLVLALGVHDWLQRAGWLDFAAPFNLHYGLPVLFIAVFWNLLGQAAAGRRAAEQLNVQLENRVRARSAELERTHAELREIHASEALAAERERIMRDMHDGIGSQLMTARVMADRGVLSSAELTALLDECLDDLRLMIDSLEPTDADLVAVLGNLRYRLAERLAQRGVELRWEIAELPPVESLGPRGILQVLRIVQEAVANVLKHSGATGMVVSAHLAPRTRRVVIRVRDNGRGPPVAMVAGRGLGNMRQRAASIGATLEIRDINPGCEVTLILPQLPTREQAHE